MRCLKVLLKAKLVHHENTKYDGYRLTYLGYDYLAIKTLVNRGIISSVGRQIGVGKEADVFEVRPTETASFCTLHQQMYACSDYNAILCSIPSVCHYLNEHSMQVM